MLRDDRANLRSVERLELVSLHRSFVLMKVGKRILGTVVVGLGCASRNTKDCFYVQKVAGGWLEESTYVAAKYISF